MSQHVTTRRNRVANGVPNMLLLTMLQVQVRSLPAIAWPGIKDVRANCLWASLLRTQIHMPRHASRARAKY